MKFKPSITHKILLSLMLLAFIASTAPLYAQTPAPAPSATDVKANYTKLEAHITMRDGVKLFTSIYMPKDTAQKYPFMMQRTPYSVSPYGAEQYRDHALAAGCNEYVSTPFEPEELERVIRELIN